jgi:hypothetical protein
VQVQQHHSPPEPSQHQHQHVNAAAAAYSNGPPVVDQEDDPARPPILDTLKSRNNYNPRDFNLNPEVKVRVLFILSESVDPCL